MTFKRTIVSGFLIAFTLSLIPAFVEASPAIQGNPQQKVFVPPEIKAVMQEGLTTRQGRQDIPFEIFKHYMFPARENVHTVILFKAKNGDLGFAAPSQAVPADAALTPANLEARLNVFFQYFKADDAGTPQLFKEFFIPLTLQDDGATYDPEKVSWYSCGYPLPAGKYTVSMALTTPDLKKVGVSYLDFELPGPESYKSALVATPLFFVKSIEKMQSPEMTIQIHKESFMFSIVEVIPNIDSIIAPGETIEIFYYVFGAQAKEAEPGQQPRNDLVTNYEVLNEDGTLAIRWEATPYDFALISQQLPMKQTVTIEDDEGKRNEQRDLPAGKYSLVMKIKDNISGFTTEQTLPFEVK